MTTTSPLKNAPFNNINFSGLQKKFGAPKQTNECSRFFPDKIANSGKDPKGGYSDFINKDLIKPLSRKLEELPSYVKPYEYYEAIKLSKNENSYIDNSKWALRTNKKCSSPEQLPKIQQYKEYTFPNLIKDPEKVEKYKNTYLKSDNISIRYPNLEINNNHLRNRSMDIANPNVREMYAQNNINANNLNSKIENNFLNNKNNYFSEKINVETFSPNVNEFKNQKFELIKNFKGKFNSNTETSNHAWEPKGGYKSLFNRGSVGYNILSHNVNKFSGCLDTGVMEKKLVNKKKILTETLDINHFFHNNIEKNFMNIINENPKYFRKYTGIFTNMCDDANRNGNLIQPFTQNLKNNYNDLGVMSHNRSRSSGSNISNSDSPKKLIKRIPSGVKRV